MKLRCIAVDDEPMALEKLKSYIEKIPYLELVAGCESSFEAMEVLSSDEVDVMFIDINMPDVNGLDFVKSLTNPPIVVFITAYAEYAVESYKVRAVDYLLKPYSFDDFSRVAGNVLNYSKLLRENMTDLSQTVEQGVLYLKVDYRFIRVVLDDVVYIEGMNEYLKVKMINGDPFLTHTTFKNMLEQLPDYFIQVHRSYVINMKHVKEVERSVILMTDGTHISVSEGNKETFMRYLLSHSLKK